MIDVFVSCFLFRALVLDAQYLDVEFNNMTGFATFKSIDGDFYL